MDEELRRDTEQALARLPGVVEGLQSSVTRLQTEVDRAADREDRRVAGLHSKIEKQGEDLQESIDKLSTAISGRFDKADADHQLAAQAAGQTTLKDRIGLLITVASGLGVPLAVALIATRGGP